MNEKAVCGNEEARDSSEVSPPSNSPEIVYLETEEDSDSKVPAVTVNLATVEGQQQTRKAFPSLNDFISTKEQHKQVSIFCFIGHFMFDLKSSLMRIIVLL